MPEDDREFSEFLQQQNSELDLLPVIHTTNSRRFSHLIVGGKLSPQHCDIFDDDILYLFYGRPAYRTATGQVGFLAKFAAPVVFIFRPEALVGKIREVYPFDTGAFERGLYDAFFDKDHDLETLKMGNQYGNITKMVDAFYTSNEEYMRNHSTKNPVIDPFDFTADGVRSVILSNQFRSPDSQSKRDERATSIELQIIDDVLLEKDNVLGIIMPSLIADVPEVARALQLWEPKHIKFYDVASTQTYEFWHGQIFAKTLEIYRSEDYI